MKKLFPLLLAALLMLSSCIKDELDACAGLLHVYFSYIYGGSNEFYATAKTDVHLNFYHKASGQKYREDSLERASINLTNPYQREKTLQDRDSVTLIAWTHDERVDYVDNAATPMGDGSIHLKEITPAAEGTPAICAPVDDLLYGTVSFDAGLRTDRNDVTIPFVRAVCRIRITMIPETVNTPSSRNVIFPRPDDYTFYLSGTRNTIDYNNVTSGEAITLCPKAYYDETDGNVKTPWFGAFSSLGEYLKVKVFIHDVPIASFDCAPIELASTPGNYIDLVIDGRYIKPQLSIRVNGWHLCTVQSDL